MRLLVLGAGSAVPTTNRNPTSQLLEVDNNFYLIDCGEGTQVRLRENKIRLQSIKCIFISHMHGDHYLGLMGLLWTMNLLGRNSILKLYGPQSIHDLIEFHQRISGGTFNYMIEFTATDMNENEILHQDSKVKVFAFPLVHKIFCTGFLFQEMPKPLKLKRKELDLHQIPPGIRKGITQGNDYYNPETGETILNKTLTEKPKKPLSYAFCSDTKFSEIFLNRISKVDLLYHESTFLESEKELARKKMHSTAKEAATIAKKAEARNLLLGHYSNRYRDLSFFLNEAAEVFPNVNLAREGEWYEIS